MKLALFPARHREDLSGRAGLGYQVLGACQMERRQRGIAMEIQCGVSARLAVTPPSALGTGSV